jgi:hypothetical protein
MDSVGDLKVDVGCIERKGIGMQDVISGICVEREETGSGGRAGASMLAMGDVEEFSRLAVACLLLCSKLS